MTKHFSSDPPNEASPDSKALSPGQTQSPTVDHLDEGQRGEAYSQALSSILGAWTDSNKAEGVRFFRSQVHHLKSGNTDLILTTLASQAMLCEAMHLELARRAASCPTAKPEAAVALVKGSLSALNGYGRCIAAIDAIRSKSLQALDDDSSPDSDEAPDSDSGPGPGPGHRGRRG
jgi:hypothetical protein